METFKIKIDYSNPNYFEDFFNDYFKAKEKHPRDEKGRFTSRQKFEEKKCLREIDKFLEGLNDKSISSSKSFDSLPMYLVELTKVINGSVTLIRNGFRLEHVCLNDLLISNSGLLDAEVLSVRSRNSKDDSYIEIILK